ncbi:MAG: hypothetical protein K9M57_06300 [Phycisphaerae bacterium]|nr:hypothetical protein [Phycisphaerae bacterium]
MVKTCIYIVVLVLFAAVNLLGDVKLPAVISDNMVLQQQGDARLWGWAEPGEEVRVHCSWEKEFSEPVKADKDGKWQMFVKTPQAGGPYTITLKGKNTLTLKNILTGEVWVCSGQSNMEYRLPHANNGKQEVAEANYPPIRYFNVSGAYSAHPVDDVKGQWSECHPKTAGGIFAVPYFFARKIHKELNVPIGLICPAMGATPARAWMSGKTLLAINMYAHEVKLISDTETIEKATAKYQTDMDMWHKAIEKIDPGMTGQWYDAQLDESSWKKVELPSTIEATEMGPFNGMVWYRKRVDIPADWAGKEMTVSLGALDDRDVTYLNGTKIGGLNDRNHSRNYNIDGSRVKAGKNTLVVNVQDYGGGGGFRGKPEDMLLTSGDKKISIAGPWLYKVGSKRSSWPRAPRALPGIGARYPSALFNGMISPLTPLTIKGAIWYQGENDVSGVGWYRPLFPNLIQSWRDAWELGDFPFYHVQLPPYDYGSSNSALLREVQMKTLSMKNVGIAVTLDIGDFKNIHPGNKKDIGERLALWALAKDYGQKDRVCSGPIYNRMKVEGAKIRLSFDHTGSGMVAKEGELTNFGIAGPDRKFVPARAVIDNKTIVVSSDKVAKPVAVRYAFDNAGVPSLFNKEGLPASSFRTDNWQN